jgi:hypothetical protein
VAGQQCDHIGRIFAILEKTIASIFQIRIIFNKHTYFF